MKQSQSDLSIKKKTMMHDSKEMIDPILYSNIIATKSQTIDPKPNFVAATINNKMSCNNSNNSQRNKFNQMILCKMQCLRESQSKKVSLIKPNDSQIVSPSSSSDTKKANKFSLVEKSSRKSLNNSLKIARSLDSYKNNKQNQILIWKKNIWTKSIRPKFLPVLLPSIRQKSGKSAKAASSFEMKQQFFFNKKNKLKIKQDCSSNYNCKNKKGPQEQ